MTTEPESENMIVAFLVGRDGNDIENFNIPAGTVRFFAIEI